MPISQIGFCIVFPDRFKRTGHCRRRGQLRADGIGGPKLPQVVFTVDLTSADGLFAARSFEVHPGDLLMVTESPMVSVTQVVALVSEGALAWNRLN